MKILITGGAGFVGSHLIDRVLKEGHQVCSIDNYATGSPNNYPQNHESLKIIEGTIVDSETVRSLFAMFKPELVVHAAASYKDPDNWTEDSLTNVVGTANVVKESVRNSVRRLIYLQTSLCYGLNPLEQPISITHPVTPAPNSYAITKTAGEQLIQMSKLDYISFRLANAYGPRNISGPLPIFYQRISSNKPCFAMETRRDFLFISDLIDLITLAVAGKGKSGAYHASSGSDVAIKDLYEETVKAMEVRLPGSVEIRPRNPEDAFTILLDPSKTITDFGWKPGVSLESGVRQAIDWYRVHGVTQTFTHLNLAPHKQS